MTASRLTSRRHPALWRALAVLALTMIASSSARAQEDKPAKPAPLPKVFLKESPESLEDLKLIQAHVKDLVKKVTPAVVGLQIGMAQGSGVIINKEGVVLTAGHVSGEPGKTAIIILPDGRRLKGKTLGQNRGIDSGMVQIELSEKDKMDLPVADMATSAELKRGHWVLAIGHPGGFQKGRHPVVRLGRVLDATDKFIRTDCTLVGGDSGGPLFDMYGRVIGIHSRIGPTITANVHVPVDTYKDTWDRLVAGESWGGSLFGGRPPGNAYMGLRLDAEARGALVDEVVEGSPAAKAGMQARDVVTMINKDRINTADDVSRLLASMAPGSRVDVKVQRGEEIITLRVTLGRKPS